MSLTGESSGLCRTGSLRPTHLGSPPFPLPAPLWVFPAKPTPLRCHRTLKLFLPRIQLDAPAAPGPTHHGQLSHIRELLLEPAGKDTDTTGSCPQGARLDALGEELTTHRESACDQQFLGCADCRHTEQFGKNRKANVFSSFISTILFLI